MTVDVRKAATDAAYIAVGIGVLGIQQAQVRRREAAARLAAWGNEVTGRLGHLRAEGCGRVRASTRTAGEEVRRLGTTLRATLPGPDALGGLVEPALGEVTGRVEVLAARLGALPERAGQALEVGRAQLAHLRVPLVAAG